MFVAWRDLKFAKGRFALLAVVVALITLLVGFLSGLTAGLGSQSISAVQSLNSQQVVLSTPSGGNRVNFTGSAITEAQASKWKSASGVTDAQPLGIGQGQAQVGSSKASIAIFGMNQGSSSNIPSQNGHVVLSETNASQLGNAQTGSTIEFGGRLFIVERVIPDLWYSHQAVAWTTLADWQQYASTTGQNDPYATALIANSTGDSQAGDAAAGVTSVGGLATLLAIGSFSSEVGSLGMIIGMLVVISAVVIGAFFTVWIMQRSADIAVLKALGSSTKALLIDTLGQAFIVLTVGVGLGILITTGVGALLVESAGSTIPFVLSAWTTLAPAILLIATGLVGACFALRSVSKTDPLTALGANR